MTVLQRMRERIKHIDKLLLVLEQTKQQLINEQNECYAMIDDIEQEYKEDMRPQKVDINDTL